MKMKQKACQQIGFTSSVEELGAEASQSELLERIDQRVHDSLVDGIIVQLPLPRHINPQAVRSGPPQRNKLMQSDHHAL